MTESTSPQPHEVEREARRLERIRLLAAVPEPPPGAGFRVPAEDEPEPREAA
jgi:hypothetical protein